MNRNSSNKLFRFAFFDSRILLFLLSLSQPACAIWGAGSFGTITTCGVPSDQTGTIEGHWLSHPIPIAFHAGDFSPTELREMTQALDAWNLFFGTSKSFPIFQYGSSASPQTTNADNPTAGGLCGIASTIGTQFAEPIGIYKVAPWPQNYSSSYIALTSYCTIAGTTPSLNGTIYSTFSSAVMEINYTNFFVRGAQQPDLQSVFLHELGHLIGLDHSCGSKINMPDCSASNIDSNYLTAVMYPIFNFDPATLMGSQKRALGANDESRANCLYQ